MPAWAPSSQPHATHPFAGAGVAGGMGCRRDKGTPLGSTVAGFTLQVASLRLEGPPPEGISGFDTTVMHSSAVKGHLRLEGASYWRCDIIVWFLLGMEKEKAL